jgi:hypothetical protein
MAGILCDSQDGSYELAVRGAHTPLAGFAIQADAPLARVAGFAPLSLTVDVVGERGELQVLRLAQNDNRSAIVSMRRS